MYNKYRKKNLFIVIFFILCCLPRYGIAQNVKIENPESIFYEYATYYVSNFNIQTGASDVQLFRCKLQSDSYPVFVKLGFKSLMISPALGINEEKILVWLETNEFQLGGHLWIDNRDLSISETIIYDNDTPPNAVNISAKIIEKINPSEFEQLLSAILTTGRLADGEYTFEVTIKSGRDSAENETDKISKTFIVRTPSALNLESPGSSSLADSSANEIYTNYPVFNWSQGCTGCDYYIRVAEYKPWIHSSLDEAIEDETTFPFNQSEGWGLVESGVSTFQYPAAGVSPLGMGKLYVWQVKETRPTTSGFEDLISEINLFKIAVIGGEQESLGEESDSSPFLQSLNQALGQSQYQALFGSNGDLEGFDPSGRFTLNGGAVDESVAMEIVNQIINGTITNIDVQVEN